MKFHFTSFLDAYNVTLEKLGILKAMEWNILPIYFIVL